MAIQPFIGGASLESWKKAYKQHCNNFVTLVSSRWAVQDFLIRLVYGEAASMPPNELGYRVSFAEMQRMYLRALQIDLISVGVELKFANVPDGAALWENETSQSDVVDNLRMMDAIMKIYTQAVRDYEYMTDSTKKRYDMFIASSERDQDDAHLDAAMTKASRGAKDFTNSHRKHALPTGPWEVVPKGGKPVPIGGTRNAGVQSLLRRALLTRVFLALLGSTFLIGPMWLLALKGGLIFSLTTTTVAVTIFGLFLAYVVDKNDQVFAGTLAYAAVLMVFVGVIIQMQEAPST